MPSPELARQLVDLGGWTVCVFMVITAFVGLFRQWWVPGYFYKHERDSRLAAETQAERNAVSLAAIAKAVNRDRRRIVSGPTIEGR